MCYINVFGLGDKKKSFDRSDVSCVVLLAECLPERGPGCTTTCPRLVPLSHFKSCYYIYNNYNPLLVDLTCRSPSADTSQVRMGTLLLPLPYSFPVVGTSRMPNAEFCPRNYGKFGTTLTGRRRILWSWDLPSGISHRGGSRSEIPPRHPWIRMLIASAPRQLPFGDVVACWMLLHDPLYLVCLSGSLIPHRAAHVTAPFHHRRNALSGRISLDACHHDPHPTFCFTPSVVIRAQVARC